MADVDKIPYAGVPSTRLNDIRFLQRRIHTTNTYRFLYEKEYKLKYVAGNSPSNDLEKNKTCCNDKEKFFPSILVRKDTHKTLGSTIKNEEYISTDLNKNNTCNTNECFNTLENNIEKNVTAQDSLNVIEKNLVPRTSQQDDSLIHNNIAVEKETSSCKIMPKPHLTLVSNQSWQQAKLKKLHKLSFSARLHHAGQHKHHSEYLSSNDVTSRKNECSQRSFPFANLEKQLFSRKKKIDAPWSRSSLFANADKPYFSEYLSLHSQQRYGEKNGISDEHPTLKEVSNRSIPLQQKKNTGAYATVNSFHTAISTEDSPKSNNDNKIFLHKVRNRNLDIPFFNDYASEKIYEQPSFYHLNNEKNDKTSGVTDAENAGCSFEKCENALVIPRNNTSHDVQPKVCMLATDSQTGGTYANSRNKEFKVRHSRNQCAALQDQKYHRYTIRAIQNTEELNRRKSYSYNMKPILALDTISSRESAKWYSPTIRTKTLHSKPKSVPKLDLSKLSLVERH